MTAAIIRSKAGRVLVVQRPPGRLLGGLWKLPGGEWQRGETVQGAVLRTVRQELGVRIRVRQELASIKQTYTHFKISLHAYRCEIEGGKPSALGCARWLWATHKNLDSLPFSRADRKIFDVLLSGTNLTCRSKSS